MPFLLLLTSVLAVCTGLAADASSPPGKVAVRLYMEFGCKHCRRYLTGPLRAAMQDAAVAEVLDLQVNPFGNSFYAIRDCEEAKSGNESVPGCGGAGGYDAGRRSCFNKRCGPDSGTLAVERAQACFAGPLIYQFGFTQMYTTRFAVCAMRQAQNDWRKYVPYFLCVEDKYDDIHDGTSSGEVAKACAQQSDLDGEELDECYISRYPDEALRELALATPEHPGVPMITVNGVSQNENYEHDALLQAVRAFVAPARTGSLAIVERHAASRILRSTPGTRGSRLAEWSASHNVTC